jgi:hypothetical protein
MMGHTAGSAGATAPFSSAPLVNVHVAASARRQAAQCTNSSARRSVGDGRNDAAHEASSNPKRVSAHGSPGSCCPRKARAVTVRLENGRETVLAMSGNGLATTQGLRCSMLCVRSILPRL